MPGRRRALLVAVDTYLDERLPALTTPLRDAEALAEVLADPSLGGYDVQVLANPRSWEVAEHVEELLAGSRRQDDILLHFGCHGLKDDGGGLYLAASNTRPQRLVSTGVDSAAVLRMMRAGRASSALLLLDCCFAGAFARGTLARSTGGLELGERVGEAISGGRGLAVLTASSATEWALEKDGTGRNGEPGASVFTRALVEGIRSGDADRNGDGLVSLGELYDYVAERVRAESPRQTPDRWEFGVRESLYVARSPRRTVAEGELPEALTRLLTDPDPRIREIGIGDLGSLARSTDLPAALAAVRRLAELAGDDSRRVSAAAARELARTRLVLPEAPLDLGLLRQGAAAPTVELPLSDLPLARLSQLRTEGAVRAWIDGDRLLVTAGRAEPGLLDGRVTLTGPVGSATVAVTGWVLPDPAALLDRAHALARTVHGNPPGELLTLAGLALTAGLCGEPDRAVRYLRPVPHLLRSLTDRSLRAPAEAAYAFALDRAGDRPAALARAERARAARAEREADQEEPDPLAEAFLGYGVQWVAARLGLPAAADGWTARTEALVDALAENDFDRAFGLQAAATVLAAAGHAGPAAKLVQLAEALDPDPEDHLAARMAGAWAGTRAAPPGALDELVATLVQALDGLADDGRRGLGLAVLGWLSWLAGDPARGRTLLEQTQEIARDEDRPVGDRVQLGLAAGFGFAHMGLDEAAVTAATEVVDGEPLKQHRVSRQGLGYAVAALIAAMSGRPDLHGQWLERAAAVAAGMDGVRDRLPLELVVLWVRNLTGEADSAEFLLRAGRLLLTADGEPGPEVVPDPVVLLAVVLGTTWLGPAGGPSSALVAEMFGQPVAELEELSADDLATSALSELALVAAFAWAAVQAGDREHGRRLVAVLQAAAEEYGQREPLIGAVLLGVLAWICALGEGRPHRLVVDAVRVLLPTECRGDRTATLFRVLADLAVLLAPGG